MILVLDDDDQEWGYPDDWALVVHFQEYYFIAGVALIGEQSGFKIISIVIDSFQRVIF